MKKSIVSFFIGFLLTFIIALFTTDGNLKWFINSVSNIQNDSHSFSVTLKKQYMNKNSNKGNRNIATDPKESKQKSSTSILDISNSYQFFINIIFLVLVFFIIMLYFLYNIFNNTSAKEGSNISQEIIQLQKMSEERNQIYMEKKEEDLKNYINTRFSDISQKIEMFSQKYYENPFKYIQQMSENYLSKFETIMQKAMEIQVEKEDKIKYLKNINRQLSNMNIKIKSLERVAKGNTDYVSNMNIKIKNLKNIIKKSGFKKKKSNSKGKLDNVA